MVIMGSATPRLGAALLKIGSVRHQQAQQMVVPQHGSHVNRVEPLCLRKLLWMECQSKQNWKSKAEKWRTMSHKIGKRKGGTGEPMDAKSLNVFFVFSSVWASISWISIFKYPILGANNFEPDLVKHLEKTKCSHVSSHAYSVAWKRT